MISFIAGTILGAGILYPIGYYIGKTWARYSDSDCCPDCGCMLLLVTETKCHMCRWENRDNPTESQ
jgi:hypothetical protein